MKVTREMVAQTVRFILVGGLNTVVDFIIFNLLAHYVFGLATPWTYFVCKSLAFVVAMMNSFFFNSRFTFKDKQARAGVWWRFSIITIATFIISSIISTWVFHLLQVYTSLSAIIAGNASVVVSVFIGMVTNFLGYKHFVFHEDKKTT
jgi:putative flippase GtrA